MNKLRAGRLVIEKMIQQREASLIKSLEQAKPKFKKSLRICKTLNGSKATFAEAKKESDSFQPEVVPIDDRQNPNKRNTIET
jgi:hypothetical protein